MKHKIFLRNGQFTINSYQEDFNGSLVNLIESTSFTKASVKLQNKKFSFYNNDICKIEFYLKDINSINNQVPNNNDSDILNLILDLIPNNSLITSSVTANSSSNTNAIQPFTNSVSFSGFPLVMEQKQISAPLTITPNTTGALPGASVLMRFIADGVQANTPIFANCQQVTGSSGWDNRAGIVNLVQFQFDGVDYFYSIFQTAIGAVLDLQAPTLLSSAINAAGTIMTLNFNEDLLATSLPISANFTGATVASASIVNSVVTLNISPAKAAGTTFNLVYSGTTIKDLAGNAVAGFTTALTVAAATTIVPANLDSRQAGIDQVSVGTYKKSTAGWKVALSSTSNFVGDKTFTTSDASLAGTGAIIGLDTRLVADANIAYSNVKYWIGYYGGSYKAATNGSQTQALAGYAAGDLMRLKRTGTNLIAQLKRSGGTWTDLFTWTGVTESLSTLTIVDDNAAQVSLIIY